MPDVAAAVVDGLLYLALAVGPLITAFGVTLALSLVVERARTWRYY